MNMEQQSGENIMRYAVKGKALMKDGSVGFPVGATIEASNFREARKRAIRRFREEWAVSGYVILIDLINLKKAILR